ncbi:protein kinase-like domain, concanavalin A-like lectin/glucanase domain protein [Tanacetum coccineum]
MGHFLKRQAYIDLESPINVMSKQHYNKIMNKGLESRQKPSNPSKNSNFVGRVKGLKVFIGNFTYECNFMILEDTTSIIDHHLGEVVFGKPFARNTGLVYDQEEGTVTFKKDDEKITFMMPHKMEASNHIDFKDINTVFIPILCTWCNDDCGKHYYWISDLGTRVQGRRKYEAKKLTLMKIGKRGHKSMRYKVLEGPESIQQLQLPVFSRGEWGVESLENLYNLYLEYGVLPSSGYGVLVLFPSWSLVKAQIRRVFLDGYGVMVFRISNLHISSFKL